jgi:peptidoglycan/LPS O-acetylase OafA/YrhL
MSIPTLDARAFTAQRSKECLHRSGERYPTLDGWRGVAILMVLVVHCAECVLPSDALESNLMSRGRFGVDLFFALSGLLITSRLLLEHDRSGTISIRRFMGRRATRILCLNVLYVLTVAALGLMKTPAEFLSSLVLVRNYLPVPLAGSSTTHLWSLSIEEHFYFAWPILLCWWGTRRAPQLAAWTAISVALWRITELSNGVSRGWLSEVPPYLRTDLRLDALMWGW